MDQLARASNVNYEAGPYFGQALSHCEINGFELGKWAADNRLQTPEPHGHNVAHIVYVWGGPYTTTARGEALSGFTPLIYNPRGTYHQDMFEHCTGGFFSVAVDEKTSDEAEEWLLPGCALLARGPSVYAIIHRLMAECEDSDPTTDLTIEALCQELMDEWAGRRPEERGRPRWLREACDLLSDRHVESVNLKEIGREVGVSAMHLARTFRTLLGCTPGEYLRARRLSAAADLLSRSRISLAQVALDSGFADQSHLTKHFSRAYGVPPGAYRRLVNS